MADIQRVKEKMDAAMKHIVEPTATSSRLNSGMNGYRKSHTERNGKLLIVSHQKLIAKKEVIW